MHFISQYLRWIIFGVALFLISALVLFPFLRRGTPAPDELECRRRAYLNRIGRIASAQVTEVIENVPGAGSPRTPAPPIPSLKSFRATPPSSENLLCYVYSVSGVRYETAQNVSGLEERVSFSRIVAGQPASVKYDPVNPGNSILVADDWSGLA